MSLPKVQLSSIGERLRYLRSFVRLTRGQIFEKYDIPEVTLNAWETNKIKISDKGIDKCVSLYRKEGLIVTSEWIKTGVGQEPLSSANFANALPISQDVKNALIGDQNKNIYVDYENFKKICPDAIFSFLVNDDMLPTYQQGDFVCGVPKYDNFELLNGKDCIALLESGETIIRKFMASDKDTYHLVATNPINPPKKLLLCNVKIIALAPIKLHRKKSA